MIWSGTTLGRFRKWPGQASGTAICLALAQHVFLTVDRNLSFQQDVNKFNIAVLVMVAKGNKHADLQPLIAGVVSVLDAVVTRQVVKVGG